MRYMLDTNVVSQLIRKHPAVVSRVTTAPMAALCISAVTEGELLVGLAKRPSATQLHAAVSEFLKRVEVLPWDSGAAESYGTLRASMEAHGKALAPLDMLIGAHAASVGAVLVTNDGAFQQINDLRVEDWTEN